MPLTPITRDTMRMLKAHNDEVQRSKQLQHIVEQIYYSAITASTTQVTTAFNWMVPTGAAFYINNMPDILKKLRDLFPGCEVTHALLAQGINGKMYDISKLNAQTLPLVSKALENSYIVIDWS